MRLPGVVDAVGPGVALPDGRKGNESASAGTADTAVTAIRAGAAISLRAKSLFQYPGISYDGGYAEYVIVPAGALALIPDGLSAVEAAPLMCAGVTTYNALRNGGARPGDLVAVLGIGGLGHLAIQFAAKMGFRAPRSLARGGGTRSRSPETWGMVVHRYAGARPGRGTAEVGRRQGRPGDGDERRRDERDPGWSSAVNGTLMILGAAAEPLQVPGVPLLLGRRSIRGWPSGTAIDSQDTMSFSALTGVRSMNEIFPLQRAADAYDHMLSGKARFRVVLTTAHYGKTGSS